MLSSVSLEDVALTKHYFFTAADKHFFAGGQDFVGLFVHSDLKHDFVRDAM